MRGAVGIASALALLAVPHPASAAPERCFGERATVEARHAVGTAGDDVLVTPGGSAFGRGGDDLICSTRAGGTIAVLDGGTGDDRIHGGAGGAVADAGPGRDQVRGGAGPDGIIDRAGGDVYSGGRGSDILYYQLASGPVQANLATGGAETRGHFDRFRGIDLLWGSRFNDYLVGAASSDAFLGGGGDDVMLGAGGADSLLGEKGSDVADGGAGRDRCQAEDRTSCERGIRLPQRLGFAAP